MQFDFVMLTVNLFASIQGFFGLIQSFPVLEGHADSLNLVINKNHQQKVLVLYLKHLPCH